MDWERIEQGTARTAAQLRIQLAQMTAASQLLERCAWNEKSKGYLAALNQGICRMLRIVGRMELCARLEGPASPEPVDLAALTRDLGERMEGLLDRAGVELTVDCPERLLARADGALVRQLLLELVSNGAAAGKSVKLVLKRDGEDAVLTVEDNGPGLPAERAAVLFGGGEEDLPDWRQGGVGIAVSRRIAALHNGRIFPVCEPGRGLLVMVSFPLNQAGGEGFRCPEVTFDRGGFDEAVVGLSHLLPAGVFAPGECE